MISALPNREVTLIAVTAALGVGCGALPAVAEDADPRSSRRAAPSSAEIVPAAT